MAGSDITGRDNLIRRIESGVIRTGMYLDRFASRDPFHELLFLRKVDFALILRFKAFLRLYRCIYLFGLFRRFYGLLRCVLRCVLVLLGRKRITFQGISSFQLLRRL